MFLKQTISPGCRISVKSKSKLVPRLNYQPGNRQRYLLSFDLFDLFVLNTFFNAPDSPCRNQIVTPSVPLSNSITVLQEKLKGLQYHRCLLKSAYSYFDHCSCRMSQRVIRICQSRSKDTLK